MTERQFSSFCLVLWKPNIRQESDNVVWHALSFEGRGDES